MNWEAVVLDEIKKLCRERNICQFTRQMLISETLDEIVTQTQSEGLTPEQTLSRILQTLRDQGYIEFVDNEGTYRLI